MATKYFEAENGLEDPFDELAPQFATLREDGSCDVFINHRGMDVKYTVASCIYHTLDLMGVVAFLDVEMLELGDVIPTAIECAMRSASVHIAIFSKNYANSPWCLSELSYMLKTGTTIIPVFYHVKPTDLQLGKQHTGPYADAFAKYKAKYSSKKIEDWKMALHRVSFHSGYTLNKTNIDEGRLLKDVVERVLKEMRNMPLKAIQPPPLRWEIAQNFELTIAGSLPMENDDFGSMQEGFETTILGSLQSESHDQVVGLVGRVRSGKTLKSEQPYNSKHSSMDWCTLVYGDVDPVVTNTMHPQKKPLMTDDLESNNLTIDICRQRDLTASAANAIAFVEEINVAFTSATHQWLRMLENMLLHQDQDGPGFKQEYAAPDLRQHKQAYGSQNIISFLPHPTNRQARSVMYDVSKHYHDTVVGLMVGATKLLASKMDALTNALSINNAERDLVRN